MKKILSFILCTILIVSLAACGSKSSSSGSSSSASAGGNNMNNPKVEISVKDFGVMQFELDRTAAPITVDNFMKLVNDGFYDGLTFHRIIRGFMIQGGDPLGNGTGGSEETIKGEQIYTQERSACKYSFLECLDPEQMIGDIMSAYAVNGKQRCTCSQQDNG